MHFLFIFEKSAFFDAFCPKVAKIMGNYDFCSIELVPSAYLIQNISFRYMIVDHSHSCFYRWRNVSFVIETCKQYEKGTILEIFGSLQSGTANESFNQKELKIQSIKPVDEEVDSVNRATMQFNKISSLFSKKTYAIKSFLVHHIKKNFSFFANQLIRAMVLGDRTALSEDLKYFFETTGMLHVLAVSGMHVGLLYIMVRRLTSRFWQPLTVFSQVLLVFLYAFMVGYGASVSRASAMLAIGLISRQLFMRQQRSWYILFLVFLILLLINPWFITQVGFQLSVVATASIIFFNQLKIWVGRKSESSSWQLLLASLHDQPRVNTSSRIHFGRNSRIQSALAELIHIYKKIRSYLREIATLSFVIQVCLAPFLWFHFGSLSILGILVGPVTLWLVPLLYVTGIVYLGIASLQALFYLNDSLLLGAQVLDVSLVALRFLLEFIVFIFVKILELFTITLGSYGLVDWPDFTWSTGVFWYLALCMLLSVCRFNSRARKVAVE